MVGQGVGEIVVERSVADKQPVVDGPVEDIDGHLRVDVVSKLAALDAELEYLPGPPRRTESQRERSASASSGSD
jgi:hypothetical protein